MTSLQTSGAARQQSGFTLIELIIVVAIGALIAAGAALYFRTGSNDAKAQTFSEELPRVIVKIKARYPTGVFTGVTCGGLASDGIFDGGSLVVNGVGPAATISHPLGDGQLMTCAPVSVGSGTDNGVALTLVGVPTDLCKAFLQNVSKVQGRISANAVVVKNFNDQGAVAGAGANCEAAATVPIAIVATR